MSDLINTKKQIQDILSYFGGDFLNVKDFVIPKDPSNTYRDTARRGYRYFATNLGSILTEEQLDNLRALIDHNIEMANKGRCIRRGNDSYVNNRRYDFENPVDPADWTLSVYANFYKENRPDSYRLQWGFNINRRDDSGCLYTAANSNEFSYTKWMKATAVLSELNTVITNLDNHIRKIYPVIADSYDIEKQKINNRFYDDDDYYAAASSNAYYAGATLTKPITYREHREVNIDPCAEI